MEKKIIFKYDRKDFFGHRVYTEDTAALTKDTVKRCFAGLKKDRMSAIEISGLFLHSVVITWNTYTDFDMDIVLVRFYEEWNSYTDKKMSFTKAKKLINDWMKEDENAA